MKSKINIVIGKIALWLHGKLTPLAVAELTRRTAISNQKASQAAFDRMVNEAAAAAKEGRLFPPLTEDEFRKGHRP